MPTATTKKTVKAGVRLVPDSARLLLGLGASADFEVKHPSAEEVVSAMWVFTDADGKVIKPPVIGGGPKKYKGVRVAADEYGVRIEAGEDVTYSLIGIDGTIGLKNSKTGAVRAESVRAEVRFGHVWGGVGKAWYPHPADWEVPWTDNPRGKRAMVLMYDLISRLPDEIRFTAGGMPIVRTTHDTGAFGYGQWDGAHVPFVNDAIMISDRIVNALDPKAPGVTPADIYFTTVVLHEMVHAVTYRKATLDMHQLFAAIRKEMRTSPLGPVGWLPEGAAATPVLVTALAQQAVGWTDFVSGYSEAADWELSSPWARAARVLNPVADVFDLVSWLARIPQKGLLQDAPLRPNMASGWGGIGHPLGLRLRSGVTRQGMIDLQDNVASLTTKVQDKQTELSTLTDPKKVAAAKKDLAALQRKLTKAQTSLAAAYDHGTVSDYAAEDVLEDIAETVRYLVFGSAQLNNMGSREYADIPSTNPGLAARRAYLVKEEVFPKTWKTPMVVGEFYRGLESQLHLENWETQL